VPADDANPLCVVVEADLSHTWQARSLEVIALLRSLGGVGRATLGDEAAFIRNDTRRADRFTAALPLGVFESLQTSGTGTVLSMDAFRRIIQAEKLTMSLAAARLDTADTEKKSRVSTVTTSVYKDGVWCGDVIEAVEDEGPVPCVPGEPVRVPQQKFRDFRLPPHGASYDNPDSMLHPDEIADGYEYAFVSSGFVYVCAMCCRMSQT